MSTPPSVMSAIARRDPGLHPSTPAAARRAFREWATERYGKRAYMDYARAFTLPVAV